MATEFLRTLGSPAQGLRDHLRHSATVARAQHARARGTPVAGSGCDQCCSGVLLVGKRQRDGRAGRTALADTGQPTWRRIGFRAYPNHFHTFCYPMHVCVGALPSGPNRPERGAKSGESWPVPSFVFGCIREGPPLGVASRTCIGQIPLRACRHKPLTWKTGTRQTTSSHADSQC